MSTAERRLSRKGEQFSLQIIEATLRCLGRDGYAATSLQRVADEAGLAKRMVVYYYGSREELFAQVVAHAGDRLLDQAAAAAAGSQSPEDTVALWFTRLWTSATSDRGLIIAWYGLVTESVTNPDLRGATSAIIDRVRGVLSSVVDDALERGYVLHGSRESLETFMLAGLQGLLLDFLQHGDDPRVQAAARDLPATLGHLYSRP
ncbi:TetR/AcrR family transcriptional regulator [Nocardioides humilatus]|uniref:TetR/AcrR family transcriptional regulator n=1 Tax=Nocardioides humilatus TaxID=2607660 RepID=A0A5B1LLI1_9ACTN|nr:TetR/AcrR family transcriptional regulator [Nocardioides humilatus]KAA1420988.1 TetR/AcrR family transcriptional regulator [Nocardioides humilatus]